MAYPDYSFDNLGLVPSAAGRARECVEAFAALLSSDTTVVRRARMVRDARIVRTALTVWQSRYSPEDDHALALRPPARGS